MRHVFIINPNAGKNDRTNEIKQFLENYQEKLDYEIYVTNSNGDAYRFAKDYNCSPYDKVRFYAVGGDGTLHEVVNGIANIPNAEVACFASGSGNDFIKNYGNVKDFLNLESLIKGTAHKIDLLKVEDEYCVNITNYGFDGEVTFKMLRFKRWPGISGPMAYNLAAVTSLLFKMNQWMKLTIDDKALYEGKALLCAVANGLCYGGGFYCAPEAKVDDGLLDVCFFKKVSKFQASSLIKVYKQGKHLTNEKLKNTLIYKKCKKVIIEGNHDIAYAIDGEVKRAKQLKMEIIPQALSFVIPNTLKVS